MSTFGSAALTWSVGGGDLSFLFDALETKGLVKTLAEPTLVTMSGDTANFLAGGEFPDPGLPVQQLWRVRRFPTITIEFKQFGISLAFTPTILQDGMINMVVNPEVSSIDPTTSVQLGAISVPGIKVRRAHTTVELRDGESFTVAGLLSDNYQNNIRQYPFIGDLPIIGSLFRSTGYQRDQTELVIVVTPHLVTPRRGQCGDAGRPFRAAVRFRAVPVRNPARQGGQSQARGSRADVGSIPARAAWTDPMAMFSIEEIAR